MSQSLYKCQNGVVVNIGNVVRFYDSTDCNRKVTVFEPITGLTIEIPGHHTEDVLAKMDIIKKMEQTIGLVKVQMNSNYGKHASTPPPKPSKATKYTDPVFYPYPKVPKGKHARTAKINKKEFFKS